MSYSFVVIPMPWSYTPFCTLLNVKKRNIWSVEHEQKLGAIENVPLDINNNQIGMVQKFKYLGITLDSTLSFDEHINGVCNKACKQLGALRKLRNCLDKKKRLQNEDCSKIDRWRGLFQRNGNDLYYWMHLIWYLCATWRHMNAHEGIWQYDSCHIIAAYDTTWCHMMTYDCIWLEDRTAYDASRAGTWSASQELINSTCQQLIID